MRKTFVLIAAMACAFAIAASVFYRMGMMHVLNDSFIECDGDIVTIEIDGQLYEHFAQ